MLSVAKRQPAPNMHVNVKSFCTLMRRTENILFPSMSRLRGVRQTLPLISTSVWGSATWWGQNSIAYIHHTKQTHESERRCFSFFSGVWKTQMKCLMDVNEWR